MNKLELGFQGGDPLTLDDIEFMRDGLAEAIKGLASVWQSGGLDSIIISGISGTVLGANTIWTSGFIVVNSEIFYVPATTTVSVGTCIDISETIDTNGDETFEDLANHSTYKIRRGVLKNIVGGPNEIDIADFVSLSQRMIQITNCVVNQETAWTNVTGLGATWSVPNPFATFSNTVQWRKNQLGQIELKGTLNNSTPSALAAFTLPVGARPSQIKAFIVYAFSNVISPVPNNSCGLLVYPNGSVSIQLNADANGNVNVDGVVFDL